MSNTPSKELEDKIEHQLNALVESGFMMAKITAEPSVRSLMQEGVVSGATAEILGLLKQEYQRGRDDERKRLTTIYDNYINYLKGDKDGQ